MKTQHIMQKKILAGLRDERGAGLLEYALIVGLIAVASITAVSLVGDSVAETFEAAATSLSSSGTNAAVDNPTPINRVDARTRVASADEDDTVLRLQVSPSTLRQASQEPQKSLSILQQASQESQESQKSLSILRQAAQEPSAPTTPLVSGKELTKDTGSQNQNSPVGEALQLTR